MAALHRARGGLPESRTAPSHVPSRARVHRGPVRRDPRALGRRLDRVCRLHGLLRLVQPVLVVLRPRPPVSKCPQKTDGKPLPLAADLCTDTSRHAPGPTASQRIPLPSRRATSPTSWPTGSTASTRRGRGSSAWALRPRSAGPPSHRAWRRCPPPTTACTRRTRASTAAGGTTRSSARTRGA